jgi:hypothetical protein
LPAIFSNFFHSALDSQAPRSSCFDSEQTHAFDQHRKFQSSHVLLLEGRDPEGLEKALRDVLALDPNHAEARHNLAIVLKDRSIERRG